MKRFTDTEIWDKEWFMKLNPTEKCLVRFIFDKCDNAGIWSPNWPLASAYIGEPVNYESLVNFSYRLEFLGGGKIFVPDFVSFQYGTLSENCKPHIKVIETLKKYSLLERVSKGYAYPTDRVEEKDKEKDKEKEKDKKNKGVEKKKEHLFSESPFLDLEKFEAEFAGTDYEGCDLRIYHEKVKNWSASGGKKKIDWIATARNFMLGDKDKGKLILKIPISGESKMGKLKLASEQADRIFEERNRKEQTA